MLEVLAHLRAVLMNESMTETPQSLAGHQQDLHSLPSALEVLTQLKAVLMNVSMTETPVLSRPTAVLRLH
jgi:hypothetical protein